MLRILLTILFFPLICNAQILKPNPNTYIDDYTNHLSANQVNDLNQQFHQLESTTGVQMAAILINDLPPNVTLEDYARDIGNTWKVGTAHNGLVYVAVLNIRRQRLEVAENLEGDIPDVTASEIIESLKDNLRQQDYYGALSLLVSQVANHLGTQLYSDSNEVDSGYQQFKSFPVNPIPESDFDKAAAKYSFYGNIALIIIFWEQQVYVYGHTGTRKNMWLFIQLTEFIQALAVHIIPVRAVIMAEIQAEDMAVLGKAEVVVFQAAVHQEVGKKIKQLNVSSR